MGKRSLSKYESEDFNVWPSFTDLMSNAFMIISLFLLLALFKSLFLKYTADATELNLNQAQSLVQRLRQEIADMQTQIGQKTNQVRELKGEIAVVQGEFDSLQEKYALSQSEFNNLQNEFEQRDNQVSELEAEVQRLKLAPPVVVIQDSGEYKFASGSAKLPKALREYIETKLVDKIEKITSERDIYVVEIIGHTDGQVNVTKASNLDRKLEAVANGNEPVSILTPGSNADLGLMRALEVVKELKRIQKTGRLNGLEFRAYSAAQLFLPSGELASISRKPNASRRRIEIRFSPLGKAETIR